MKILKDLLYLQKRSIINVRLGSRYVSVACDKQRNKSFYMKNLKLYGTFLWMGFNYLKATESLPGDSLFFTIQSPGVSRTHLINFSRIKG